MAKIKWRPFRRTAGLSQGFGRRSDRRSPMALELQPADLLRLSHARAGDPAPVGGNLRVHEVSGIVGQLPGRAAPLSGVKDESAAVRRPVGDSVFPSEIGQPDFLAWPGRHPAQIQVVGASSGVV
jgi:hypothetical protein